MLDFHQAMMHDAIQRQLLNVITPDVFKKNIASAEEQHAYSSDVQVWMLDNNVPCQAFPLRKGGQREIVVLPLFPHAWFQTARLRTFKVPAVWDICKIISYTLTKAVRQKGAVYPRHPFVVSLDPSTPINGPKPIRITTTDPKIKIENVDYIPPITVTSNQEMLREVIDGEQHGYSIRLCRETTKSGTVKWFWEPISYLSSLRLMSASYPENGKPSFTVYGEIEGRMVTMILHKVSDTIADAMAQSIGDYLDKSMVVRYSLRPGGFDEYGDNAVLSGALCSCHDANFVMPDNNKVITC